MHRDKSQFNEQSLSIVVVCFATPNEEQCAFFSPLHPPLFCDCQDTHGTYGVVLCSSQPTV